FPGFGYTFNIPNLEVALSALGSLTTVTVLSSPKLLTLDNKPATIEVGDPGSPTTCAAGWTICARRPSVSMRARTTFRAGPGGESNPDPSRSAGRPFASTGARRLGPPVWPKTTAVPSAYSPARSGSCVHERARSTQSKCT